MLQRLKQLVTRRSLENPAPSPIPGDTFRQISFTFAVIALSARIACLDGPLTPEKYVAFRESFPLQGGICGKIRSLFALACRDRTPYASYVMQIKHAFPGRQDLFQSLLERLFSIAATDGELSLFSEQMLRDAARMLDIGSGDYVRITGRDPHRVLGLSRRATARTLKERYHELVQRYHPDRYSGDKLSPEVEMLLKLKTSEINEAYRVLRKKSGLTVPIFHTILAILVAAAWGGNFVSAKFGMMHFPPFFLTMLRFCLLAPLLLPFVARPGKRQLLQIAALSSVLGVMHFALLFASLYVGLDIASCTITVQLGVPFSCLLGAVLHRDPLGPWRIGGMMISFIGMAVVADNPNILHHLPGFLLALAGAFCWGISNILIKSIRDVGNFQTLAWMALFAAPQLLLVSLIFEHDQWHLLLTTPLSAMLSVAYTIGMSTLFGYGLWYYLLQKYPVSQVAPYSLLTPVFGTVFGQWFFTESLSWQTLLGGVITIAGVAIIVKRRPKLMEIGEQV